MDQVHDGIYNENSIEQLKIHKLFLNSHQKFKLFWLEKQMDPFFCTKFKYFGHYHFKKIGISPMYTLKKRGSKQRIRTHFIITSKLRFEKSKNILRFTFLKVKSEKNQVYVKNIEAQPITKCSYMKRE